MKLVQLKPTEDGVERIDLVRIDVKARTVEYLQEKARATLGPLLEQAMQAKDPARELRELFGNSSFVELVP